MSDLKVKEYQPKTMNNNRDEVDLRYLFEKIGDGFNYIKNSFASLINLFLRNIKLILAIVLISIGAGYLYYKIQRPYYNSAMTLMLYKIRNEFVEDQLRRISEMVEDGNHAGLAAHLEISPETAAEIKSLQFTNIDQDRITEDSILTGAPFKIELSLYNNQLFSSMEPAITNFLENNRFFSKQKQIREIQVRKMITKLRSDIGSIDTLKTTMISPKGPVNGFVYGEALDPTNLYRESINLYKEQVELESDLDRLNTIEVINGFAPRLRPSGPRLRYYLAVAGLLGLLVGMIAAARLEKRRRGV